MKRSSSDAEYGTVPQPASRASARNILAIIGSKKNHRGVRKAVVVVIAVVVAVVA